MRTWIVCCGFAVLLSLVAVSARADVHMPTGEYRVNTVDLRVKLRGGFVEVARSWQAVDLNAGEYRWFLNPAWADLDFELDVISGEPKTILRAGSEFERGGNDVWIWHRDYFIRAERDATEEITGWRWYDREGNWIRYSAPGKIVAYGDRNGTTVSFQRNAQGQIEQLLDASGTMAIAYTWSNGHVVSVTDRAGRTVGYHWQGDELARVTGVLGYEWLYAYSGGLLTQITDPEGHATTIAYSANRAIQVTDALGHASTYNYSYDRGARKFSVVIHSPEGRRTERHYGDNGQMLLEQRGNRVTSRMVRDGDHVEITINERGGRTRVVYDANHKPVATTYPDGSQTTSQYDAHGNLIEHVDARGTKTTYQYDDNGNLTKMIEALGLPEQRATVSTWDEYGQRLSATIQGATPAEDVTTSWTYDAFGNVATITDPEGHVTGFGYHVTGTLLQRTDALGKVWTQTVDAAGQVTASTDPLGHSTAFEYDKVGNRTKLTDAMLHATSYGYDGLGRVITITDPLGHTTSTTYTADGQRATQTDAAGRVTEYDYDAWGRLTSITDPADDVIGLEYGSQTNGLAGLLTATVYPTYREEYKYDPRGRKTQTIRILPATAEDPEIRLTSIQGYDAAGNRIAATDAAGHSTLYAYDALNRLIQTTDALGGATRYSYDDRDNLISVTDAKGHSHSFTYDKANRVLSEARPSGATITYAYDALGRLTQRASPAGERREYAYDDAGRRIEERLYSAGATDPDQTITYSYDARGALTGYAQTGLTQSSASYEYDAMGHKITETVTYGTGAAAFSLTTHASFTATGQKQSFTYPGGSQVAYGYSAAGRIQSATLPGNAGTIEWQAYQWQQPSRIVMPGAVRSLQFDALQRPLGITSQAIGSGSAEAPQGDIIMDYRYQYDAAGNITQRSTAAGPYAYQYDALDRLTQVTPPDALQQDPAQPEPAKLPVEAYSYDPVHNRLSSQHQPGAWQYNQDNQLLAWGIGQNRHQYSYNPNGATATETIGNPPATTRQYHYNAAERLSEVTENGQTIASYQYDPMGRRITKTTAQGTTWFLYADQGLIGEYTPSGNLTRAYGWQPGNLWGTDPLWLADITGTNWTLHFYHNDHLGTPQRLTDTSGAIVWSAISEAFGKTTPTVASIDNPLRFPGQYFDKDSAITNNRYRRFISQEGRYLLPDPDGLVGGINIFTYALANPLTHFDNLGLFCISLPSEKREWYIVDDWTDESRMNQGVALRNGLSPTPRCKWPRTRFIKEVRLTRTKKLCFECIEDSYFNCGRTRNRVSCGFHIKYGKLQTESRVRDEDVSYYTDGYFFDGGYGRTCVSCTHPITKQGIQACE